MLMPLRSWNQLCIDGEYKCALRDAIMHFRTSMYRHHKEFKALEHITELNIKHDPNPKLIDEAMIFLQKEFQGMASNSNVRSLKKIRLVERTDEYFLSMIASIKTAIDVGHVGSPNSVYGITFSHFADQSGFSDELIENIPKAEFEYEIGTKFKNIRTSYSFDNIERVPTNLDQILNIESLN